MIQDSAIVSTGMGDRGTSIGIEPTESAQVSFELQVFHIVYLSLIRSKEYSSLISISCMSIFINRTVT